MFERFVRFEEGTYGTRAVLVAPWSSESAALLKSRPFFELHINNALGWKGESLDFLYSMGHLHSLKILDFSLPSIEPVHALHDLRELSIGTYCMTELRFQEFPLLETCGIEWRPKAKSISHSTGLKSLFVNRYKGRDLSLFSELKNLEVLTILNAPLSSVSELIAFPKLRRLRFGGLRCLKSLDGLQHLTSLVELNINTCRKITSIDEIASLRQLKMLHFSNNGSIQSISPVNALENLETFIFTESTNVVDGDLSPLLMMPRLKDVSFQDRSHYSHKRAGFSKDKE